MNQNLFWLVVLLLVVLLVLWAFYFLVNDYEEFGREYFVINSVCATGLPDILRRSMGLLDGDNLLPPELTSADALCINQNDFRKPTDSGLISGSSLLTVLYNLFQSNDNNGIPYIDKYFDWKIKNSAGSLVSVDWSAKLDASGSTSFQNTISLITNTIIPMVISLRNMFSEIASSSDMADKYNMSGNSANKAFINGFLAKYKDFNENSASRLRTPDTEENTMYRALTDRIDFRDPIITSNPLKNAMKMFALSYLFNVSLTANAQCAIKVLDTQIDNDIKLYVHLKKLLDIWREMGKSGPVAFVGADLNDVAFPATGDYSKDFVIKYFVDELKNPLSTGTNITVEDHVASIINKMVNQAFITDGGVNDGRLIDDPECKSDIGKLLCNLRLNDSQICRPNMEACIGVSDFNAYCAALGEILGSANNPEMPMPSIDLNNLPSISTTTTTAAATTTTAGQVSDNSGTTTTAAATTTTADQASSNSGTTTTAAAITTAAATTVPGGDARVGARASAMAGASNEDLQSMINQYGIPAYLDRSTQELLIFVYEKLAASYNFDDDEVSDDIKQAISQLPPSGRANICARYCPLTMRCNAVCKLAGCLNCQVGVGSQAGSEALGMASSSIDYASVDDDYNLLGFLDDISQSRAISGSITSSGVSSGSGQPEDLYKHMGPIISQKDTSGVSNIFAPYIIMAPKKDGTEYGAYLLDDPNDPQYRQYINDLIKSY